MKCVMCGAYVYDGATVSVDVRGIRGRKGAMDGVQAPPYCDGAECGAAFIGGLDAVITAYFADLRMAAIRQRK